MPWCPYCNKCTKVHYEPASETVRVPAKTVKYDPDGNVVGYDERTESLTKVYGIPRCGGVQCNRVFEFPDAGSKEAYFYALRDRMVRQWHDKKPVREFFDLTVGGTVFVVSMGIGIWVTHFMTDSTNATVLAGFLVGIGAFILWVARSLRQERRNSDSPEMKAWQSTLDRLRSMRYSEANYQELMHI